MSEPIASEGLIRETRQIAERMRRNQELDNARRNVASLDSIVRHVRQHRPIERVVILSELLNLFCQDCGREHEDKFDRTCHQETP